MFRTAACGLGLLVLLPLSHAAQEKKADTKKGDQKTLKVEGEVTAADPILGGMHYKAHTFLLARR